MAVLVKVCGITSYADAALALDHGVHALGFNFFPPSPRYIQPSAAREIIWRLPPLTSTVGLFVNVPHATDVEAMAREATVHVLQLHGDESPEYCRLLSRWPIIKALRIDGKSTPENLSEYSVGAFLLDSKDDIRFGGTGKSFDWTLSEPIKKIHPIILAGGLEPDNVIEAIKTVDPYGIDVCSGVEKHPGRKDPAKLAAFMNEVEKCT